MFLYFDSLLGCSEGGRGGGEGGGTKEYRATGGTEEYYAGGCMLYRNYQASFIAPRCNNRGGKAAGLHRRGKTTL
jgi:hypothetical protein